MSKNDPGNFFESYSVGQRLNHATPRTVTQGEGPDMTVALPTVDGPALLHVRGRATTRQIDFP